MVMKGGVVKNGSGPGPIIRRRKGLLYNDQELIIVTNVRGWILALRYNDQELILVTRMDISSSS